MFHFNYIVIQYNSYIRLVSNNRYEIQLKMSIKQKNFKQNFKKIK